MNPFNVYEAVKGDYLSYIKTFQKFRNPRFEQYVADRIRSHEMLYREPLIQISKRFKPGRLFQDLVAEYGLDKRMDEIFAINGKLLQPYHHQEEAVRITISEKRNLVVTTGTGSGKSLCFELPVIDHCLKSINQQQKGIKAIIIYPMNALANAQYQEIARKLSGTGVTIGLYTGDTAADDTTALMKYREVFGKDASPNDSEIISRQAMQRNPPDILVTNFVELELMLTRLDDRNLFAEAYKNNLRYLVMDELHTYTGKKGADVAFLIRRLKQRTNTIGKLQCIGTSATMVSENPEESTGNVVARFASKLFGEEFLPEDVVQETLDEELFFKGEDINPVFGIREGDIAQFDETSIQSVFPLYEGLLGRKLPQDCDAVMLGNALQSSATLTFIEKELSSGPATVTGLARKYQKKMRPRLSLEQCKEEIIAGLLLGFAGRIAQKNGDSTPRLVPKLHAFFNQGKDLRACLVEGCGYLSDKGEVTCPECEKAGRPYSTLYPVHFCRYCGQEYYGMQLDRKTGKTAPWTFFDLQASEDGGYYNPDYFVAIPEDLPEKWKTPKKGDVKKYYEDRVPLNGILNPVKNNFHRIFESSEGRGVFLPQPFPFCLHCGTEHSGQVSEYTKLFLLNSIGRATGTDILISSTLNHTGRNERKIIGFSDNRQDAAFQAGHLNDWYGQIFFRKALRQALWNEEGPIPVREIPRKLIPLIMGKGFPRSPQERIFERYYLRYLETYLFVEIRGTKKFQSINLEDTGLIEVGYDFLEETIISDQEFSSYPFLNNQDRKLLVEYLTGFLDIFRMEVAIGHNDLINKEPFRQEVISYIDQSDFSDKRFFEAIEGTKPGGFTDGDPHNIRYKFNPHALGTSRRFSSWIRKTFPGTDRDQAQYVLKETLRWLREKGYLVELTENRVGVTLLSPELITIRAAKNGFTRMCRKCDSKYNFTLLNHCIQLNCKEELVAYEPRHNYYYRQYAQPVDETQNIRAGDHSAQVSGQDRKIREKEFREGSLQALLATPTMELGIDIGDLSAVYMRNVPPNAGNYTQRSGRSGRNKQGSIIETFCGSGPGRGVHDQYFYNHPEEIVSGNIAMPRFSLQNETLFIAHLHSLILQSIDSKLYGKPGQILDFGNPGLRYPMFPDFKADLAQKTQLNKASIIAHIQAAFRSEMDEAESLLKHIRPDDLIIHFHESLDMAFQSLRTDYFESEMEIRELDRPIRQGDQANNEFIQSRRKALENRNQRIRNGDDEFNTYSYLSGVGFLPNYAFPRKTIPLRFYFKREEEALFRDHQVALSEYAPNNTVYFSGQKLMVDRLSREADLNNMANFLVCANCGYIEPVSGLQGNSPPLARPSNCGECGAPFETTHAIQALKMPGMYASKSMRITSEEEERSRSGFQIVRSYHTLGRAMRREVISDNLTVSHIAFERSAKIYQINLGNNLDLRQGITGFILDPDTGKWISRTKIDEHYEKNPGSRIRMRQNIHLYVESSNDVLIFSAAVHHGEGEEAFLRTLQYALISGICRTMDLDESEIDGFIQPFADRPGRVIIFERSEGGTGTLSSIPASETMLKAIARKALHILHYSETGADHAEERCNTVCYDCICTFYNQRYHHMLDRTLVREYLLDMAQFDQLKSADTGQDKYEEFLNGCDSQLERDFLIRIKENGLPIPDEMHRVIVHHGVPVAEADFYYDRIQLCVFIDGPVHKKDYVSADDRKKREKLTHLGYNILTVNCDNNIVEAIERIAYFLRFASTGDR